MKVLLYTEGLKHIGKSGLGKAVKHQIKALEDNNIKYTLDPSEKDYDMQMYYFGIVGVVLLIGPYIINILYAIFKMVRYKEFLVWKLSILVTGC